MFQLAFEPMFVRDFTGRILEWNRGAQELYGYTRDEAVGAISHELLKTRFPVSLEDLVTTLEQTALWVGTLVHTTRDGRMVPVESRHQLYTFDNTRLVLETNREITVQRALFENMTEWVNLWKLERDPAGNIRTWRLVDINPAGLKGWGKTREETIGRTADEIFPGATEHFLPIVQKIFSENAPHTWESYFPGTHQYLLMTSVPFGEYFLTTGSDITDLKQAEQTLRENEERFRVAQELSPDGFLVLHPERDADGRVDDFTWLYANATVARMANTEVNQLIGRRLLETFPSGAGSSFFEAYVQVARTGEPAVVEDSYQGETIHSRTWFRATVTRTGEDVAVLVQDITGRKQADAILRDSEQRFRSFFENAAIGAAQINAQGRFIEVNERMSQITGYSRDELLQMGPLDLDHPDDREVDRRRIEKFFHSNAPYLFYEKRYVHKAGHVVWVRVTVAPVRDAQGAVTTTAAIIEDITERKAAEEALRLRESEVRTLVENSQDFIVRLDRQARQIYANPATARLYGLPLQEFLGKNLREMGFPEEVWRPALKTCEQVFDTGQAITLEQMHPFGGTSRYFEARHVPEFDSNGSVVTVLVVTREITGRKRAEAALRRERDYIQRLLDTVPAIVLLLAPDGTIQDANTFFESLTGWRLDEIRGQDWFDRFLPERDREQVRTLFHTAVSGAATHGNINAIVLRDGSEREIEWFDQRLTENGTLSGLLAIGLDVSDRLAVERRRHEDQARLRLALDAGLMGTWDWNLQTGETTWDAREHQLFGFTPGTFSGRIDDAFAHIHPEDRQGVTQRLNAAIRTGEPLHDEFRVLLPDGTVTWLAGHARPLRNPAGTVTHMIGLHYCITARKLEEQAREQRHEEQMARLYRIGTVNELASGLAHELSQPLTAIQNYAGGCLKWLVAGGEPGKIQPALQAINDQSQRVVEIIQHLRRLMKTGDPQRTPGSVNDVVARAVELLKVPLARKNVKVELSLADHLPSISMDALQIEQVLIILLRNCIDVFEGQYLARPRVEIRTAPHHDGILLEVADNGPGATPETREKMFEPFYTTKLQGMGLGLMLARSIVRAHHGHIRAHAHEGGGMLVRMTLPVNREG